MYNLQGKTVLITGASSGIGKACVGRFAKEGCHIIALARNEQALQDLKNTHKRFDYYVCDMSNPEELKEVADSILQNFEVDIIIHSAGIAVLGSINDIPISAYKENLEVNFFAPLRLTQLFIPSFKKRRSGQMIFISSGVGKRGLPKVSSYCVSKFALNGFVESLRVELMPYNIDVISVSPGLVQTDFSKRLRIYGDIDDTFTDGTALTPQQVANSICRSSVKQKREVTLSLKTRIGTFLAFMLPNVMDKILLRKSDS